MAYVRKTIGLEETVYDEASHLLKEELGMSVSKFIEITLRQLVRSRTASMAETFGATVEDLLTKTAKRPLKRKRGQ